MQQPPPTGSDIAYQGFRGAAQLAAGSLAGAVVRAGAVAFDTPIGTLTRTDPHTGRAGAYDRATWTSPVVEPGFAATEVVPSWTADTPGGSWIRIELRGTDRSGQPTRWYDLGSWAGDDDSLHPTSCPGQDDADGRVDVDVFRAAAGREWTGWQLRVTLLRPTGTTAVPVLRSAGAVASAPTRPEAATPTPDAVAPGRPTPGPGTPTGARGLVLDVPRFSQRMHLDHQPHLDRGGRTWCSPTSTAMVLAWWGTGPTPADYAWVGPDDPAPWVDHAARRCFDHAFGAGNWPFNTAYAGSFGLDAFVTRLRCLAEAELFIAAGIPLVISVSFTNGQVPGLDYDTSGHLLVLVGFTADGDPVLNDPNWPTEVEVRRTVPRAALATAWQASSSGLTYVIRPDRVPLPATGPPASW